MKLGLNALLALTALVLSGCATHQKNPGGTFDLINQELKGAAATKAKSADDAVSQAMLPPLQVDLPASAQNVEPRFDLVVSNAPASQVFMALVTGTRYSMLVAPDVSGNVTVNLKSVTVREALETLRELYGYEFKYQGTRIYIQSNAMQSRLFQINYLAGKRQGQSDIRVTSSSISTTPGTGAANPQSPTPTPAAGTPTAGSTTSSIPSSRISTTSNSDFWHDLSEALTAIVGVQDGRSVIVSPGSGVVLVKAFPADIRAVESYLRATQIIVERQVMLEAKIVEVSLNEDFQSGVNWSWFGGRDNRYAVGTVAPGTTLNTTGTISTPNASALPGAGGAVATSALGKGLFGLAFQMTNFAALLNFLETQGSVQVLSSPRIATINNQKAVLKVGTDEFFITNITTTPATASGAGIIPGTTTVTTQPFFSGIALDVTPQIDESNNIILHVHPSISVVAEKQKVIDLGSLGTFNLPLAASTINETDSIVRVQDGQIVAIGGLMKQEQSTDRSGLPGASSVRGFGTLFSQRSSGLKKSELVILIKPTVIQNESSWKDDLLETQARLQQFDPRQGRSQ